MGFWDLGQHECVLEKECFMKPSKFSLAVIFLEIHFLLYSLYDFALCGVCLPFQMFYFWLRSTNFM